MNSNPNEQDGLLVAQVGICRFCGQTVMFESVELWNDEDSGAAMHCTCEQAIRHQQLHAAYKAVEQACVEFAPERGFDILNAEQVNRVKEACTGLLDGSIDTVTFRVDEADSIRLTLKGGRVVVRRTRKLELELM